MAGVARIDLDRSRSEQVAGIPEARLDARGGVDPISVGDRTELGHAGFDVLDGVDRLDLALAAPGIALVELGGRATRRVALHRAGQADAERLESFNGRTRGELLNEKLFFDLDQPREIVGAWVADYNTARPHSSLGYRTRAAYADQLIAPPGATTAEALIAAG